MRLDIKAFLAIFWASAMLNAGGTATMSGYSEISAAPDFVKVSITVNSECYATPLEAVEANRAAVSQIQSFLQSFIATNSNIDRIHTDGGMTSKYRRVNYDVDPAEVTCENTFKHHTDITFKTEDVENFSTTFAKVQQHVLSQYASSYTSDKPFVTYATINNADTGICESTRKELKIQAQKDAMDDAIAKFATYARRCGINPETAMVEQFGEPTYNFGSSLRENYTPTLAMDGPAEVRISFEPLSVSARIDVKFIYTSSFIKCFSDEMAPSGHQN